MLPGALKHTSVHLSHIHYVTLALRVRIKNNKNKIQRAVVTAMCVCCKWIAPQSAEIASARDVKRYNGERAFLNSLKIIIHVRKKRVMKHRCAVLECGGLKKKERKTALYHMRMLSSWKGNNSKTYVCSKLNVWVCYISREANNLGQHLIGHFRVKRLSLF